MPSNPPAVWIPKTARSIHKVSPDGSVIRPISNRPLAVDQLRLSGNGNKGVINLYLKSATGSSQYCGPMTLRPNETLDYPIGASGRVDLNDIYYAAQQGDTLSGTFTALSPTVSLIGGGDTLVLGNGATTSVAAGTAGNVASGTFGVMQNFTLGHASRFRQDGTVRAVELYVATVSGVAELRIQVWRRNNDVAATGGSYALVGESENIRHKVRSQRVNLIQLEEPIHGVQHGDYWCAAWVMDSNASVTLTQAETLTGCTLAFWRDVTFPGAMRRVSTLWEAGAVGYGSLGTVPIIGMYMDAPTAVFIGDSQTAGHGATGSTNFYSYLETATAWTPDNSYGSKLAGLLGVNFQNHGIGSQTSTQIAARIAAAVATKAKVIILQGGVNDIAGLGAGPYTSGQATFIANFTTMLNAAVAAGMIPIVLQVFPWTNGTLAQMQARDLWNAQLATTCASYPTALCLNLDTALGQNRASANGTNPGNLWDIQTALSDGSGIHGNDAFHVAIATAINTAWASYCATNNKAI